MMSVPLLPLDAQDPRGSGTPSRAQLPSGRSNQMVGLPLPQERLGQEGESKPDSCFGWGTAQLEHSQEPAPGGVCMCTLLDDRREGGLVGRRYGDKGVLWAAATYTPVQK